MPLLFSYGTLRDPAVQRANFGRELHGREDALPGYRMTLLEITDAAVVALSGTAQHPVVAPTGNPVDEVAGMVFDITDAELVAADGYEVDDYRRELLPLVSGAQAWVYVSAR
ncbi:gamma-glutamylcyclotransferase family protein [Asanoa sp. NPDC049573]|uniref:gamma-glutamylcyclotransferase family protein n=1 Tax=Asanoa sp. NPDC049573 TaxID=3155396 RepID=UPI00344426B2